MNSGSSKISVSGVTITPGTADVSAYKDHNYCTTLIPGQSCQIGVNFLADAVGTLTATLNINNSGPGSPQQVALTANVIDPAATFEPSPLNFGTQTVSSSTMLPLQLTNTGQTPLVINSSAFAISGTDQGDFSQTNNCPASLPAAPGSNSCTIEVTFKPGAKGPRTARLTVSDNVVSGKSTVTLEGKGH